MIDFVSSAKDFGTSQHIEKASWFSIWSFFKYHWYTLGRWCLEARVDSLFQRIQNEKLDPDTIRWASLDTLRALGNKLSVDSLPLLEHAYCRTRNQKVKEVIAEIGQRLLCPNNVSPDARILEKPRDLLRPPQRAKGPANRRLPQCTHQVTSTL